MILLLCVPGQNEGCKQPFRWISSFHITGRSLAPGSPSEDIINDGAFMRGAL